ncbi:hypothetical protein L7F22_025246, partial [Adiantum nelumboides]|nr:hypothetical protein [Adiantum nelumboides]
YTDTGFNINNVLHEGSLMCHGNLILSWTPKTFKEIMPERCRVQELWCQIGSWGLDRQSGQYAGAISREGVGKLWRSMSRNFGRASSFWGRDALMFNKSRRGPPLIPNLQKVSNCSLQDTRSINGATTEVKYGKSFGVAQDTAPLPGNRPNFATKWKASATLSCRYQ